MDGFSPQYLHEVESMAKFRAETLTRLDCEHEFAPVVRDLRQRLWKKEKGLSDLIEGVRKYLRVMEYWAIPRPKRTKRERDELAAYIRRQRKAGKAMLVRLMQDARKDRQ
jgi:hypothetical protein